MRKSFTLLFSTLVLLCAFGFSSFAAAPQLAGTDPLKPANGNDNVDPTTTDLVVTFDQNVQFTTEGGTLTVWRSGTPVKTVVLAAGNANATISDNKLTVKPGVNFTDGTTYAVTITGGIENAGGEAFAGIASGAWVFTIGDYTAPVVKTLTPADDAANVDVKADPFNLVIEFDDVNDIVAVDGKKIYLYRADGTIVDLITIATGTNTTVSGKTATVVVDPDAFRDELTQYYVNIEGGAFVDASDNSNKYAGLMNETGWTFTSRDYSAPYVTDLSVTDVSYETATLNVTANEAGSVWYAVATSEPTYPDDYTEVATGDNNAVSVDITGLTSSTDYTVYVKADNAQGTQPNASTEDFTTLDDDAPLDINETNDEIVENNVTVGVELAFNEEVVSGTGDLLIKRADNNETVRTVPADQLTFAYDEENDEWVMTARFEGLESEEDYYVFIPDGLVEDVAGNAYVSTYTNFDTNIRWTFTSSDFIVPTVTVSVAESTPPAATDNILVEFSEAVQLVDGTAMAGLSTNAEWFDYIALEQNNAVVPFTAAYADGTITIDPVGNLLPNTTYVVKIRANAFEDLNDNAFSATHTTYDVTTADFSDAVITLAPANGTNNVEQGTQPTVTFSKEPMYVGGESPVAVTAENIAGSVTFTDGADAAVDFTVDWNAETYTLTIVPAEELESEATYNLAFDADNVADVNGVDFTGTTVSAFTMVDYVVPTITFSHSGTVDDKLATENLTLTVSEDVTLTTGVGDLVVFKQDGPDGANLDFTATISGNVVTIDPAANLVDGEVYYYGIGAGVASDGTNTNEAAFSTFTFAPAAVVPGGIQVAADGYDPAIGATDVTVDESGNLVATLTFSEAVKANPVMPDNNNAILYHIGETDVDVSTVAITAADVEGSVLTITFLPPVDGSLLVSEGEYYITLDADVVVANADNTKTFAGISANEWTFMAADDQAPTLTATAPTGTGVALDDDVVIGADEAVTAVSGDITIAAGTADVKTIAVTSENVVIDNEAGTITVLHEDFTQYNTEYTVTVPAGAFEDEAGNESAELTWTFTTLENTGATFVLDPFNGEDMVAAGTSTFTITFSEDVKKGPAGTTAYLYEAVTDGADIELGRAYVEQGGVVVDGNVVTFDFGASLEADKDYYIVVEAGMFTDVVEPALEAEPFAGLAQGDWEFYTYDKTAPIWTVSYDKLGEGMAIGSDITVTFNKAVDFNDAAIANADIANMFTLTIGDVDVDFTGTINAENTVIVLNNSSFVPPLTEENSEDLVVLTPVSGFKGIGNDLAIDNTAAEFRIADYEGPVVTLTAADADVEGTQFKFTVSSNEDGTLYWLVKTGTADASVTAEEVMAGTAITGYEAGDNETVTVSDLQSETAYTVYAVATDANNNVSELATPVTKTTDDITAPSLVEKTSTFTEAGEVTLTFSEDVVPGGAVAVIREAGTLEVVERVTLTGDGSNILTITAAIASLDDTQQYIIEVEGDKVADAAGNTWDGWYGLADNAWVVSMPDRTAPTLVSIEPELSATAPYTEVAIDTDFVLTFSEDIQLANDAQILFYHINGGVLDVYEVLDASSLTVDGNTLTLSPTRDFIAGEEYQLTITGSSIMDMAETVHYYTSAITRVFVGMDVDETAPVATFSPADGDTGASQTSDLTITFNEPIVLRDGSVVDKFDLETMVYLTKDGEAVAHTATIAGNVITINPTESLEKGAQYTYGFTADFMDAAENEVPAEEATFTVVTDAVTETYIVFEPDNGEADATVIPVDQVFRIIFSGELYTSSSVNSENNIAVVADYMEGVIKLNKINGETSTAVDFEAEILSRTTEQTVVTVTPVELLASTSSYELSVLADTLQLGVGNVNVLDFDSNDYFTEDVAKPVAGTFVPADGTSAPSSTTLSISFNEDVKVGTGTIEIKHAFGEVALTVDASELTVTNNLVEITELTALEDGQEYFVIIPAGVITDLAGNAWDGIAGEDDWNFIISQDMAAPAIVTVSPVGPNALANTHLQITFDRPVVVNSAGTGFIALYTADGTAVQLIRVNDGAGNITFNEDNTVATIDIVDLEENTQYEVEVAEGTFALEADNSFVNAAYSRTMWTFSTEDNNAPANPVLTPADDATGVELNAVASMEFGVDVQAGTGVITLRRGDDASVVHSFDVTSDEVTFNGNVVSFSLNGLLEVNTDYYIIVPAGSITNVSETPEAFAGLEQTYNWNFTTSGDTYAMTAIADVQGTDAASPMVDDQVRISGTVTAVVAGEGFFVQDANAAWSGIWVASAEETLPAVGDGVVVRGTVAEVENVTTIAADSFEAAEATLTVEPVEVAAPSDVEAEMYESVLVKVLGARATAADENGVWSVYYETADDVTVNNWLYEYAVVADHWYNVTGVVDGTTDTYTLNPRMEADIYDVTLETGVDEGARVDYNVYPNPFSNYINIDNAEKLSRIVITNIAGQRVMDVQYPEHRISTDNLVNGVYVISLFNEDGMVKSNRIVKR